MNEVKARAAAELLAAETDFRRTQSGGTPEEYARARERLRAAERAVEALLACEKTSAELLTASVAPQSKQ